MDFMWWNCHGNLGENSIIDQNGTALDLKTLSVAPGRKLVNYTFAQFYVWKKHTIMYPKKNWMIFQNSIKDYYIVYIYMYF